MKIPKSGRKDISGKRKKKAALTLDIDDARQGGTGLKQLKSHTDIFGLTGDDLYMTVLNWILEEQDYIPVLCLTHVKTINKIFLLYPATGLTETFMIKVLKCNEEKDD